MIKNRKLYFYFCVQEILFSIFPCKYRHCKYALNTVKVRMQIRLVKRSVGACLGMPRVCMWAQYYCACADCGFALFKLWTVGPWSVGFERQRPSTFLPMYARTHERTHVLYMCVPCARPIRSTFYSRQIKFSNAFGFLKHSLILFKSSSAYTCHEIFNRVQPPNVMFVYEITCAYSLVTKI